MQCAAYIFLERNYTNDARRINDLLQYYKECGRIYQARYSRICSRRQQKKLLVQSPFGSVKLGHVYCLVVCFSKKLG